MKIYHIHSILKKAFLKHLLFIACSTIVIQAYCSNNNLPSVQESLTSAPTRDTIVISGCGSVTSPSGKYVWTVTGNYRDTLQNVAGCDSLLLVMVSVHPIPVAFFRPAPFNSTPVSSPKFTFNDASSISSGAIDQYHWDFGVPSTSADTSDQMNPTYTYPSEPGSYNVHLSAVSDNGCESSFTYPVHVFKMSSVHVMNTELVTVHPNPSNGAVNIVLDRYHENVDVIIKNMSGEIIQSQSYQSVSSFSMDLIGSNGIYLMQVQTSKGNTEFIRLAVH